MTLFFARMIYMAYNYEELVDQFLEQNSDLLETDNLDGLFEKRLYMFLEKNKMSTVENSVKKAAFIRLLHNTFIDSGVDPLDYMSYVPINYFYYAFGGMPDKDIVLESNIVKINARAFQYNIHMNSITADSVLYVGNDAFTRCNITKVSLRNVKYIAYNAFADATIGELHLGDNLSTLGEDAFRGFIGKIYCNGETLNTLKQYCEDNDCELDIIEE